MIQSPYITVAVLVSIEISILYFSQHDRFKRYFNFLPAVFWIYFLPMLVSTAGLIDTKDPVLSAITANLLPAALVLLLIPVDIKAILRLGPQALVMFFAGSLGIILGAPLVFFVFKGWLGGQFWSGFGALAASWTGGSANMVAVREALGTPDEVYLPMVVVDTIVPYLWMGALLAMARLQPAFDHWNGCSKDLLERLSKNTQTAAPPQEKKKLNILTGTTALVLLVAAGGSLVSQCAAKILPEVREVFSASAWTIIIASCIGIGLSFTPVKKIESCGSSKVGYFLLYFVLTSIGAKANLSAMTKVPVLIPAGLAIVVIHAGFILAAARITKAPLFLAAAASQANIGGVASAPVVAEAYQPHLASVGLLLAVLGNIVGTYMGILAGQLCRMLN